MKIDRGEVEELLRVALTNGASCQTSGAKLAELCRTWLAVQDAPVALMDSAGCLYGDDQRVGDLANQRVRLVRDGGE